VPEDIEGLVMAMQRSMPIDLFDPSDLFVHHTVRKTLIILTCK